MKAIVFALPGNEPVARKLAARIEAEYGRATVRHFPDGESYVRLENPVRSRDVVLVCTLVRPDEKFLALCFMAATARDLGAASVGLVCPYLPYMRQDTRFKSGEGVTSVYFGEAMSRMVDWIVTIDPHLHRRRSFAEIYSVPVIAAHAAPLVADWIRDNVRSPVIVGPDAESAQWATAVAQGSRAAWLVLRKQRGGDRKVALSQVPVAQRKLGTPVVIDDIVSTGQTMLATVRRLRAAGYPRPYCIGIHGIFADHAYRDLRKAGARQVVSCNTVPHATNAIDVTPLLANAVRQARAAIIIPRTPVHRVQRSKRGAGT